MLFGPLDEVRVSTLLRAGTVVLAYNRLEGGGCGYPSSSIRKMTDRHRRGYDLNVGTTSNAGGGHRSIPSLDPTRHHSE